MCWACGFLLYRYKINGLPMTAGTDRFSGNGDSLAQGRWASLEPYPTSEWKEVETEFAPLGTTG